MRNRTSEHLTLFFTVWRNIKTISCGHFCNHVTPCGYWWGPTWQCFHSPFHSLPSFSAHWWATWNLSPASLLLSLPPSLSFFLSELSRAKCFSLVGAFIQAVLLCDLRSFSIVRNPEGGPGLCRLALSPKKNKKKTLVITTLVSKLLWQYWVAIDDYIQTQPLSRQSCFEFNLHWNLMIYIYYFSFNNTV